MKVITTLLTLIVIILQSECAYSQKKVKGEYGSLTIYQSKYTKVNGEIVVKYKVIESIHIFYGNGFEKEMIYGSPEKMAFKLAYSWDSSGNCIETIGYNSISLEARNQTPNNKPPLTFSEVIEKYKDNGQITSKTTAKYDGRGNKIEEVLYKWGGKDIDKKYTYKYDEYGSKIEEVLDNTYISDTTKYTYKYNEQGKKIEKVQYLGKSIFAKITYNYNDRGNLIEVVNYHDNGSIESKSTYKYDETGNIIEAVEPYFKDGYRFYIKTTTKYDTKGNKTEKLYYGVDNSVSSREVFKYDDKGNMIEWIEERTGNELSTKKEYFYSE